MQAAVAKVGTVPDRGIEVYDSGQFMSRDPNDLGLRNVMEAPFAKTLKRTHRSSQITPYIFMMHPAFPGSGTREKPRNALAGCYRCRIRARPTRVPRYWKKSRVQSAHRYQYPSSVRLDLSNYHHPG